MTREYSLAHLTVLSLTPPQLVDVAARTGYDGVGVRMTRVTPDEVLYPLATDRIVGTDIFQAMILLGATGLAQIGVGNVDLWMVAALLMGSIPGVLMGSQLTVRAPNRVLRGLLAAVLFLSGLALLFKG